MKPSELRRFDWDDVYNTITESQHGDYYLKSDVDPLIEAKDKEIERLNQLERIALLMFEKEHARVSELEAEIERLTVLQQLIPPVGKVDQLLQRISELEAEIHGLCKYKQELADENARLRDLCEVYVPKGELE